MKDAEKTRQAEQREIAHRLAWRRYSELMARILQYAIRPDPPPKRKRREIELLKRINKDLEELAREVIK